MRKSSVTIIICLISTMLFAGCDGRESAKESAKETEMPTDVTESRQVASRETETPAENTLLETPKPEENEETVSGSETEQEYSEPADNYYIHRFDSYDDLLYAYKEAQDRYYTKEQIELIFGWGETLIDHGWPCDVPPYDLGYVYYDVNSDGTNELILTLSNDIVEIYSYFTGKVQRFYSAPYGDEVTLYPGGILKQHAPDSSEFPGTTWYSYDAGLAGYYADFEESMGEFYTFCHYDFSGSEYDEIAARLRGDPDADMPVWIYEYLDWISEADYKKLVPKSEPIILTEGKKLADVVLPDGYKYRYEANEDPN